MNIGKSSLWTLDIGYNIEALAVYYIGFLENLYQNNKYQIL